MTTAPRAASDPIVTQQRSLLESLPFSDTGDFEAVSRGFVARRQPNAVTAEDGRATPRTR